MYTNQNENFSPNESDIVMDTLSNLAKRQGRRLYFKKSLITSCAVFAFCLILGSIAYIKFGKESGINLNSFFDTTSIFSLSFKEFLRSELKLFATICAPMILMFCLGFTLFSTYICIPTIGILGGVCGFCTLYFTSNILTNSPSIRFTLYYIVFLILCIIYIATNIFMASLSMSFCSALKHNTKTPSRMYSDDASEYFTFFTNSATVILLLVLFRCISTYTILIFK